MSVRAVRPPRVQRALRDLDVLVTEHPKVPGGYAEQLAEWLDAEQIDSAEDTD